MFSAARWRLTSAFTVVLAVILLAAAIAVYLTTRSVLFARVDDDLEQRAVRDLSEFVGGPPHGGPPGEFVPPAKTTGGYFYAVVDGEGKAILSSSNVDSQGLAPTSVLEEALRAGSAFASTESSEGESLRVYVLAARTQDGSDVLAEIGRSTEPEHSALSQLRMVLLAIFGGSIIPAAAAGFILSGRTLRPIRAAMDAQRTFVADASHELRTPVAVVRTNAELVQRHLRSRAGGEATADTVALEDIVSESERLGKMVSQMLTLAESDGDKAALMSSTVDLSELTEEVARAMRALANAKGIAIQTRNDGNVWVRGDRERLREALVTLLDNAIKYTDAGGRVDLEVGRAHRRATVTVADTGSGIPADSLPHIFDRFYRVDKARSRESGGTGLGLSIAHHIVEAHGGSIRIESEVGKGTRATIELRLASRELRSDGADGV